MSKNLDNDYILGDWAFQYADNEYVPLGFRRHGESIVYEYLEWKDGFHSRCEEEKENSIKRKEERLRRAQRICDEKRAKDAKMHEHHNEIMKLSIDLQIEYILNDQEHNILYYMPVIENVLSSEAISELILRRLLERLLCLKTTPFNKRLIRKLDSKLNNV